jgi:hypothetical protein
MMMSVTVVLRVSPPPVPVMVSVALAGLALGFALTVSVVPVVELVGLNEAVVRCGKPASENVTALLNPFTLLIVTA